MKKAKINGQQPVLYILMRTDLLSLNPGKAMAQACHGANQCVKSINNLHVKDHPLKAMLQIWEGESGRGFGTTIVLNAGSLDNIKSIFDEIGPPSQQDHELINGIVLDDTYPLKDGDVLHLFPLQTCAFIFCDRTNMKIRKILDKMELHK